MPVEGSLSAKTSAKTAQPSFMDLAGVPGAVDMATTHRRRALFFFAGIWACYVMTPGCGGTGPDRPAAFLGPTEIGGDARMTGRGSYTYAPLAISSVTPNTGFAGTKLTIEGTGFLPGALVTLGGIQRATPVVWVLESGQRRQRTTQVPLTS